VAAEVHEIASGIYRISQYHQDAAPVEFSQFLIKAEQPLLFHTGSKSIFPETLEAVKKVIDPSELKFISWSHLESDECGAVRPFLDVAPDAQLVHGQVGTMLGVGEFFDAEVRPMGDGDVLDLGSHRLQFMITPHVPHAWDAILCFEETTGTLLCSDLFTVFGKSAAMSDSDPVQQSIETLGQLPGYLPVGPHTGAVFDRLEGLNPKVLAGHHSAAYTGNAVQALRDLRGELFKFAGMAVEDVVTGSDENPEDAEPYG
jgi:flavorubredoxin